MTGTHDHAAAPPRSCDPPLRSALYVGHVMHQRRRPFRHRFRQRVFALWLDLDEIALLNRRLRLFGVDRARPWSFRSHAHGPERRGADLKAWAADAVHPLGVDLTGGSVRLLCFPRFLGYGFSPLTVWYCSDAAGHLRALIHEVRNRIGQKHAYALPVTPPDRPGAVLTAACDKRFYVSPFIDMGMRYRFRLREPGATLRLSIRQDTLPNGSGDRAPEPQLTAAWWGDRRPLTDAMLTRLIVTHPAMSWRVVAGIYWQAVRLRLKGARLRPPPAVAPGPLSHPTLSNPYSSTVDHPAPADV